MTGNQTIGRKMSGKTRQDDVGVFSHVLECPCLRCGAPCVCVEVKHLERKILHIRWECERCTAIKDGEPNGN